ncbi:unknown protein [Simkania negevensis Z]|uniref:Uncharacterized protein n=1 Tax=Simkania negevensis (strain ATCC VR-1471 / DSM 27360 / Z) TaxID=331113 RepID=F8L3D3_SIMNZ|nr:unknown protein [Simkania negevensis Z]
MLSSHSLQTVLFAAFPQKPLPLLALLSSSMSIELARKFEKNQLRINTFQK